jgi:hypothetical protein
VGKKAFITFEIDFVLPCTRAEKIIPKLYFPEICGATAQANGSGGGQL